MTLSGTDLIFLPYLEGIKWEAINYFNNKIVCDLFEGKNPPGLMAILDDVCRSVHGVADGADQALSQRLTGCSGNKHFDMRGKAFLVRHYAGDVRNGYFYFLKVSKCRCVIVGWSFVLL